MYRKVYCNLPDLFMYTYYGTSIYVYMHIYIYIHTFACVHM